MKRESMEFDVLIIGGGPSGLSASIRLRQLALEQGHDVSVCVIEKGSEIGAHILSGAVLEPRALDELLPDWRERGADYHSRHRRPFAFFDRKTGVSVTNSSPDAQ